ncbi:M23 family metallopeptidase [Labrys monachus]|uniref:Murein DD-endopeptidase MepM/ murein hydrolase activator NlpD n=1 Tax=Labrys monachus TaxID=217067 RepID=A0ABU0F6W4_9HYPH|nr:M23 family metallopeptidase [Labrys monachus]MDQ0390354.1 murein DD-endopeptidase MepM/ murein hydrolase activator NlpD [Labrys monachus]
MSTRPALREARSDRYGIVDPGTEPPLSADGGKAPDRRKVSLRWLTGTILTGLFGAGLMGGAVYAALDGEYSAASAPQIAPGIVREGESQTNTSQKGDRILIQTDTMEAHQVVRISTTTRVGDKDVIKVKPFAHVLASLQLASSSLASQVPPYDPQALTADPNAGPAKPAPAQAPPAPDDGEVTVSSRDLAAADFDPAAGPLLPEDQVLALVRAEINSAPGSRSNLPDLPPQFVAMSDDSDTDSPDLSALRETDVPGDPDSALRITIVPENFTDVNKTAAETRSREQTILVEDKDTLASILHGLGSTPDEVTEIAKALGDAAHIHGGLRLRVLVGPGGRDDERIRPVRLSVYNADQHLGTVVLADTGGYVSVQDPNSTEIAANAEDNSGGDDEDDGGDSGTGIRLYYSIFETALKQQVPPPMIERLLRIYAYDVDLTRRTRPGDNFEVFYEQDDSGKPVGDILYTALTVGGELKRYYRFASLDDGKVDYYDEDGKSARKFLMRKPIVAGEMRSTFGMRRHPILGYYKMHTGVDWAAPIGTPIQATGNGTIIKAGWSNGYGRHIEIQHANGYVSTYSHMSGFAAGSVLGAKVTMGQVIGYLGMTGLATGPHVHYEVKINGSFVDPMRIKLPQGRELGGQMLASFKEERDRIDSLMRAPVAEASTNSNKT